METITGLDTVYLHVTKACNLQCIYCYFSAGEPMAEELSTPEMVSVLEDVSLLGPRRVVFTGGEPLLRRDTVGLAEAFRGMGKEARLCVTTNGTLVGEANVQSLVENFDEIRISIDGFEETNDALRAEGTFRKVMKAFRHVLEAGGDPVAFITVTSFNLPDLKGFMGYLLNNGICKIHVSPLKAAGRAKDDRMFCDLQEMKGAVADFWYERFGLRLKSGRREAFNCGVGKFLTVYPDGSVYPCHLLAFPEFRIGNVRQQRLHSIYHDSELMGRLRSLHFSEIARCRDCFKELSQEGTCLGSVMREEDSRNQLLDVLNKTGRDIGEFPRNCQSCLPTSLP